MIRVLTENPILLIGLILVITYFMFKQVEKFTGVKAVVTGEEYLQDIRVLNSYVGPYIGEIYAYLRAKYFDPVKNKSLGPYFQPSGPTDPTLADPLLPIARAQLKAWIDSAKLRINQKYGKDFLAVHALKNDLSYVETPEKVLQIVHIKNGVSTTFIV